MMQAAVFEGLGQPLRIERVAIPKPGPGEVLLKVRRCGICGSDLHMTQEAAFGLRPGDILGHEFAGEVVETGSQVDTLRVGQSVAVVPYRSCGHCVECLSGNPAWCADMVLIGGGYGEYACVSARQCVPLPQGASFVEGALVEPLAVALHGVEKAGLRPGQSVVIIGAGPIGLAVAFWARRFGARQVVVQDVNPQREALAHAMGATHFVCVSDASAEPVAANQADIVFECVGAPGLISQAMSLLRTRGTLLILGLCTRMDSFVPFAAVSKELRIQTSAFFDQREYEASLDVLASGAAEPLMMVSGETKLQALPALFESLKKSGPHCKVMICHDHSMPLA